MRFILALILIIPRSLGLIWDSGDYCYPAPSLRITPVKVRFFLCTPISEQCSEIGNSPRQSDLRRYGFNTEFPTFVLVHGFLRTHETFWVQDIVKALREGYSAEDANVILVDWSSAYFGPRMSNLPILNSDILNYKKAAISTSSVAAQTARLLDSISSTFGVPLRRWYKLHFIGHSLGAHIAGQAARNLKKRVLVHRVTGLDPAGPCFEGFDTELKLNRFDAAFVDVIHTNSDPAQRNNFGIAESIGTIDFYPNGGNHQPRCSSQVSNALGNILESTGIDRFITKTTLSLQERLYGNDANFKDLISNFVKRSTSMFCDHEESARYFVESMQSTRKFYGVKIGEDYDYDRDYDGPEAPTCVEMGMYSDMSPVAEGDYFLDTTEEDPRCTTEWS